MSAEPRKVGGFAAMAESGEKLEFDLWLVPSGQEPAWQTVTDPTEKPDPQRWGWVMRGPHAGKRVYWDASLYARHQHAWTTPDRKHRFLPEEVQADRR